MAPVQAHPVIRCPVLGSPVQGALTHWSISVDNGAHSVQGEVERTGFVWSVADKGGERYYCCLLRPSGRVGRRGSHSSNRCTVID